MICHRLLNNQSKNIIYSRLNVEDQGMFHRYVLLTFCLVVIICGIDLVCLYYLAMVWFTSCVQLFPLGVYTNGSLYWRYVVMLRRGLKAGSLKGVSNANLAISWLEATFPELAQQAAEGGNQPALKTHPYALFDASVSLQGPLLKVYHGKEEDSELKIPECEGRAVGFLYKAVSKDSILVTAWSSGQLQIDALADER